MNCVEERHEKLREWYDTGLGIENMLAEMRKIARQKLEIDKGRRRQEIQVILVVLLRWPKSQILPIKRGKGSSATRRYWTVRKDGRIIRPVARRGAEEHLQLVYKREHEHLQPRCVVSWQPSRD
jgi:hypothetical protein